jgi:hypothetical protein
LPAVLGAVGTSVVLPLLLLVQWPLRRGRPAGAGARRRRGPPRRRAGAGAGAAVPSGEEEKEGVVGKGA